MKTSTSTYTVEQITEFTNDHIKHTLKGCIAVIAAYPVFKDQHDIVRNLADYASEFANDLCFQNKAEVKCFDDSSENRKDFLELDCLLEHIACVEDGMDDRMEALTELTAKLLVRFNYAK